MASIIGTIAKARRIWRKDTLFGATLAWEFLRLQLGYSFFYKFRDKTRIAAMGQIFHSFSYRSFLALFEEIYVGQPYAFACAKPNPVIFDCGSNIGISVLFFKKLFPNATIECFEPDPATFAILQQNIASNRLENVRAHAVALSDKNGEITFYNDPNQAGNLCMSIDAARMSKNAITVPTRKLSDLMMGPVDYCKIDVEGAEHLVIDDLAESGKLKLIDQLFIEYHHHIRADENRLGQMLAILEANGFGYQIAGVHITPQKARQFQDVLIYAYRV